MAPQKIFGSSLHRVQICQVQFQEDGFPASLFFEFFGGEVSLSLTTASDVNLGIVLKEGLGVECYEYFFQFFITRLSSLFSYAYCNVLGRKCGLVGSYLCWLP